MGINAVSTQQGITQTRELENEPKAQEQKEVSFWSKDWTAGNFVREKIGWEGLADWLDDKEHKQIVCECMVRKDDAGVRIHIRDFWLIDDYLKNTPDGKEKVKVIKKRTAGDFKNFNKNKTENNNNNTTNNNVALEILFCSFAWSLTLSAQEIIRYSIARDNQESMPDNKTAMISKMDVLRTIKMINPIMVAAATIFPSLSTLIKVRRIYISLLSPR